MVIHHTQATYVGSFSSPAPILFSMTENVIAFIVPVWRIISGVPMSFSRPIRESVCKEAFTSNCIYTCWMKWLKKGVEIFETSNEEI